MVCCWSRTCSPITTIFCSYNNNLLAIDPTVLPPDVDITRARAIVRPPDHAGVVVDFGVRRIQAALLKLRDKNGQPLPVGSVVHIERGEEAPVGFDGEVYITGLQSTNYLEVQLPGGKSCAVSFRYHAKQGEIPVIGP